MREPVCLKMSYQNLSLLYYPTTPEGPADYQNYLLHELRVIENSAGGDCLFRALSQCRGNIRRQSEYHHGLERKRIVAHVTGSDEKWNTYKDFIRVQHKDEIPSFKKADMDDKVLRSEYKKYMSKPKVCGTLTELEIAASMEKTGFNFTLIKQDYHDEIFSISRFTTESGHESGKHFYFLFTGNPNDGHWETMQKVYSPSSEGLELPEEDFYGIGCSDEGNERKLYLSNVKPPSPRATCMMCSKIGKLKSLVGTGYSAAVKYISKTLHYDEVKTSDSESDSETNSKTSDAEISAVEVGQGDGTRKKRIVLLQDNVSLESRSSNNSCRIMNGSGNKREVRKVRFDPSETPPTKKTCREEENQRPILVHKSTPAINYRFAGTRVLIFGGADSIGVDLAKTLTADRAYVLVMDHDQNLLGKFDKLKQPIDTMHVEELNWFDQVKHRLDNEDPFDHIVLITSGRSGNLIDLDQGSLPKACDALLTFAKYLGSEMSNKNMPGKAERTLVNILSPNMDEIELRQKNPVLTFDRKTMQGLTKLIASELLERHIRINNVVVVPAGLSCSGLHGIDIPEEVLKNTTHAVLYLSSLLSEMISGATLHVEQKES